MASLIEGLDLWGRHFEFKSPGERKQETGSYAIGWLIRVDGQDIACTYKNTQEDSVRFLRETLEHTGVLLLDGASLVWSEGSPLPILVHDRTKRAEVTFESLEEVPTYLTNHSLRILSLSSPRGLREGF